jgi:DNA-binding transcriptional ArsR family regulator
VEDFALVLNEAGLPRMAARVFAYVLAEDSDSYTAAELAKGLGVSRAAISGAVRPLVAGGLLAKGREPGARADHYRIDDNDVWAAINLQQLRLIERWKAPVANGVELIGSGTRGGRRLLETLAFFRYLERDFPSFIRRWHEEKDRLVAEVEGNLERGGGG